MRWASAQGTSSIVVSRSTEPTLALLDGEFVTAHFPVTRSGDSRGAGDSLTAGIAATLAKGGSLRDALRTGTAAGMLNAARRGLGTGRSDDIAAVARQVEIVSLEPDPGPAPPPAPPPLAREAPARRPAVPPGRQPSMVPPARQKVEPAQVVQAATDGRRRADQETKDPR